MRSVVALSAWAFFCFFLRGFSFVGGVSVVTPFIRDLSRPLPLSFSDYMDDD